MNYIHPTALIGPNVIIEDDCYIGPYCVIGFPPEWKGHESEDMGVIIKRGSRLTGLVTVDTGVDSKTVIGEDCYLMKHSHVGHCAYLGKGVIVSCGAKIGGHCTIGEGVNLGLNSVVHQWVSIARSCMIGMGAVITKKLITHPCRKYAGNPARDIGGNHR